MSATDLAAHLGQRRAVVTTHGATLTGILTSGPADLLAIDMGDTTLFVHPTEIDRIYDHREGRFRDDGTHHVAAGLDDIDPHHWHRSLCVHEAGHAVIARTLALDVTCAYVGEDRTAPVGGEVSIGAGPAQYRAVAMAAGAIAHSRYLGGLGYTHPLTAAAVEILNGQGDHRRLHHMPEDGYTVWRRQADTDAAAMLAEAPVWLAVLRVADALATVGPNGLDRAGIDAAIAEMPLILTDYRPWGPSTPVEQESPSAEPAPAQAPALAQRISEKVRRDLRRNLRRSVNRRGPARFRA